MKKALYIGIFSGTNIGDLAISNQISNLLMSTNKYSVDLMDFYTLQIINRPCTTITKHGKRDNKLSTKKIKDSFINLISQKEYRKIILKTLIELKELVMSRVECLFFKEYKKIIDEYEIVFIGGGNLLMSISHNLWAIEINKLIKIAKKKEKTVIIISVGAGPIILEKSRKILKEALTKADYISVRDEYSKSVIEELLQIKEGIHVSGDPVLLLKNRRLTTDNTKEHTNIAMSIMPFGHKNFLNLSWYREYTCYLDMYKNIIEYIITRNPDYVFCLFSTEYSDYTTIIELYDYILEKSHIVKQINLKVQYIESLDELLCFYQTQDLLIGTRMHSLIIALTQNLPIIAIAWQDKVSSFMRYVNLEKYCYSLNEVDSNMDRIYSNAKQLLLINSQVDIKNIHAQYKYNMIEDIETAPSF